MVFTPERDCPKVTDDSHMRKKHVVMIFFMIQIFLLVISEFCILQGPVLLQSIHFQSILNNFHAFDQPVGDDLEQIDPARKCSK